MACGAVMAMACGGSLAVDGTTGGGTVAVEAGAPAQDGGSTVGPVDSGSPAPDASSCACGESCFFSAVMASGRDGGSYRFDRQADLLGFFDDLASLNFLDVAPHGVSCSPEAGIVACTYDPLEHQLDPSDVHYSNALQQFVGPEGHPWVWAYFPDRGQWWAIDGSRGPTLYQLLSEYNACPAGQ
jgi:hypothetical protein